jgi:hypothetical protein
MRTVASVLFYFAIAFIVIFLLFACFRDFANAADRALILTDQDQKDLVQALDAATKAQGLAVAPANVRLYQKLLAAPVVTEQSHDKPAETK